MILIQIAEVAFRWYQEGESDVKEQQFTLPDIGQMVRVSYANQMRNLYYANKKLNDGEEYYFTTPILSIQRFSLTEATARGERIADMKEFDLFRLPKNAHLANVYLVSENCSGTIGSQITQVSPSEENFYIGKPDFSHFMFYRPQGRKLLTFNIPPCVKEIEVETTYDVGDGLDIPMDIASDIVITILTTILKIKGVVEPEEVRKKLMKQEALK